MIFQLVALLAVSLTALAQNIASPTLLVGTWSSGSKNVVTGPGFATPANTSFTYPPTTGVSYSFTSDGFYEVAQYRFVSNATRHKCITGVMIWSHGTYVVNPNNSISMTTFGDGYQQVQNPCSAITNFVQNYNNSEYYEEYQMFQDPTDGLKLHLFAYNGVPVAPQFLVSSTPNMLPTQKLRNVTAAPAASTNSDGVTTTQRKRSSGERRWGSVNGGLVLTAIITTLVGGIVGPMIL